MKKNIVLPLILSVALTESYSAHSTDFFRFYWSDAMTTWNYDDENDSGSDYSYGDSSESIEDDSHYTLLKIITPANYTSSSTVANSHSDDWHTCGSAPGSSSSTSTVINEYEGSRTSDFPIKTDLTPYAWSGSAGTGDMFLSYDGTYYYDYKTTSSDNPSTEVSSTTDSSMGDTLYGCRGTDTQSFSTSSETPDDPANGNYTSYWSDESINDTFASSLQCNVLFLQRDSPPLGYNDFYGWTLSPGPQIFSTPSTNIVVSSSSEIVMPSYSTYKQKVSLPAQAVFPLEYPSFGYIGHVDW